MLFKRKLTEVAVDSVTEYLQEKFEKLKQFDLDQNGEKDVDEVIEILGRCGRKSKEMLATTNFSGIAAGLEQMIAGSALIRQSFDNETISALLKELSDGSAKLSVLAQLSIQYIKDHDIKGHGDS